MKTKEELNELKTEYEATNEKPAELTDEELTQVSGGAYYPGSGKDDHYTDYYYTPEGPIEYGHQYG